jgi:hypothetical protein
VALAANDSDTALREATRALDDGLTLGVANETVRQAWPDALEAALSLRDLDGAERLLAIVADRPPGHVPPFLRVQHIRFRALVAAARGGDAFAVESDLRAAVDGFRSLGYPFWLGRALLDLGEWLTAQGSPEAAVPAIAEAVEIFTALGAKHWQARAEAKRPDNRAVPVRG